MIGLLVVIVVAGVIVYLLNNLIPMDPKFRMVANVLIGLFLFLYVLDAFGLFSLPAMRR